MLYSFSDVSFGDGMTAARSYSVTDYVISIKRLKMEDWRIIISVFKGCEWRDLDRKEGAREGGRQSRWFLSLDTELMHMHSAGKYCASLRQSVCPIHANIPL